MGDYSLEELTHDKAQHNLNWAARFVARIERALAEIGGT